MAERLVADSEEIDDFVCDKSAKNWRDKINNLSKKYKTVKDKSKLTVEGSKDIKSFPEFNDLNDIWDKRLIKSQVRHPREGIFPTDHYVIEFDIRLKFQRAKRVKRQVFDFKNGNFDDLRESLTRVPFELASSDDINEHWSNWFINQIFCSLE